MNKSILEVEAGRIHAVQRVTLIGMLCNILLSVFKFLAGIFGHSQALIADSVHSLSDLTTDLAILIGVRYWTKPADAKHPHGHHRAETVVTLSIGILLAIVATGLAWNSLVTLRAGHQQPPGMLALAVAVVSVISKEILFRWTVAEGYRSKSMSLVANAWHHRSDAFSSIPVVIAVGAAAFSPEWSFLDHVGAIAVSLFIYQAAWKIAKPSFHKLIDSGAPDEDIKRIEDLAAEVEGVLEVHGIRSRYIGGSNLAIDLHIEVDPALSVRDGHDISEQVKQRLLVEGPDVTDVVVHLEPYEKLKD